MSLNGGYSNASSHAQGDSGDSEDSQSPQSQYKHEVYSTTRYMHSEDGIHKISQTSIGHDQVFAENMPEHFAPERYDLDQPPNCPVCRRGMMVSRNRNGGWAITRTHLLTKVSIVHFRCSGNDCKTFIVYDGFDDGLVNHGNYLLFDTALLFQAATLWAGDTAIKSWWESILIGYSGSYSLPDWKEMEKTLKYVRGRVSKVVIGYL